MRAISALAAVVLGLAVLGVPGYAQSSPPVGDDSVRPFHISIPEEQLVELRQRIAATRWPDKETVNDESQGAGALLGQRLQLAQRRSDVECAAGVCDHNRRRRYPVHPRAFA